MGKKASATGEKRIRVPAEDFVRIFNGSESYQEVADKTGLAKNSVMARATSYRKKGVNLKRFAGNRGAAKLDVNALNELIGQLEDAPVEG